ncbi:vegetative incompatibility protein het-e-1 [Fusarium austroafricanum]|uniref:Vegetative incompatibility protein het-e-1 n=1 Tax=Fusarium austroafricanum TaxID=2364996 RepID=A0A8H4KB82_9HYPO|nr:vegetative incompatibility protein het-e-1 [Fusarium austroafricanum]
MQQAVYEDLAHQLHEKQIRATVYSRAKTSESISKSIERRQAAKPAGQTYQSIREIFDDLHDLVGFRVSIGELQQEDIAGEDIWEKIRMTEARFNSKDLEESPKCHKYTRLDVRKMIRQWVDDTNAETLLWLHAPAGTGKSTLARTHWSVRLWKTLRKSLQNQFDALLYKPLSYIRSQHGDMLIIIDALDECTRPNDIPLLLKLFASLRDLDNFRLCVQDRCTTREVSGGNQMGDQAGAGGWSG